METPNELFFHVAFYINPQKTVLSGKTYKADSIISAIEKYQKDEETPLLSMIKYVSNENNMSSEELKELRVQRT
jgi:hypothetical protein